MTFNDFIFQHGQIKRCFFFIFRGRFCKNHPFQCMFLLTPNRSFGRLLYSFHNHLNSRLLSNKFDKYNQSSMQPSSVVIYSLVIRSFSLSFPFHKGKNGGNISKNDMTRNGATSSPEGA